MERKDLVADMKKEFGSSFAKRSDFAKYMGYKDPHSVDAMLKKCERYGNKYHVLDLADMVMERER